MQINSLLSGAVSGGYYDYFSSPNASSSKVSKSEGIEKPSSMPSPAGVEGVTPFRVPEVGSPLAPSSSPASVGVVDKVSFSNEALAYYDDMLSSSGVDFASSSSSMQSMQPMSQQGTTSSTYSPASVRGVMASNATASDVYTEAASGVVGEGMMSSISSELALRVGVGSRVSLANPTDIEQRPTTTEPYGASSISVGKGYATAATESFINTYA